MAQRRITPWVFLFVLAIGMGEPLYAAQSVKVIILPFHGLNVDIRLTREAEEGAQRIMLDEGSFEIVPISDAFTAFTGNRSHFSRREELQELMKKYGAEMTVEGLMTRDEENCIDIQIRITSRSSTWRPPTILSATASVPEYVIPRVDRLMRQFLNRYYDEQSMERFFQSALVPGLGQFREGHTTRGELFFLGTVGLVCGSFLLSDGDPYCGHGTVDFKKGFDGSIRWYIDDKPVSPEEAEAELQRRADAEDSREKAERKKLLLLGAGIALYAVNLYDILNITKQYDRVKGGRFSFRLNPLSQEKVISLHYNFDM